jgi:hypothetical protein
VEGATPLPQASIGGLTVCGLDVDWYRLDLDRFQGARVAILTSSSADQSFPAVFARVTDETGAPIAGAVGALGLPGLTLLEITGANEAREVYLSVSANTTAQYALDFESIDGLCAGDYFDLYGDRDPESAPVVSPNTELQLRACIDDIDLVRTPIQEGDQLSVSLESEDTGAHWAVAIRGDSGQVLASQIVTSTVTAPLISPTSAGNELWVIEAATGPAPSFGQDYTVQLARRLGACTTASPISASASASLASETNLGLLPCARTVPESNPDRIFQVVPPRVPSLLRASVRPANPSTGVAAIALLADCQLSAFPLACDRAIEDGGEASVETMIDSPSPIYLMVSSADPTADLIVDVTFDEDDNFTCLGDRPVSTFAATNTTELLEGNSCGFFGDGGGPDRFFSLPLGPGDVAVLTLNHASGAATDSRGFLWVGTDCSQLTETCVAADILSPGHPAQVVLEPESPTNYVIAVDGLSPDDAGEYTLGTFINPMCLGHTECGPLRCGDQFACEPPPPNDVCDGEVLVLDAAGRASLRGTTGTAMNSYATSTSGDCGGLGDTAPDVVYQLVLATPASSLRARITDTGWDPLLSIRSGLCADESAEIACQDDEDFSAGRLLPDMTLSNVAAGTYFLIVDAFDGDGPFTLEVEATP